MTINFIDFHRVHGSFRWRSIIVIVTAAAYATPLADGISGPDDEREHSDTNEKSASSLFVGTIATSS